MNPGQADPELAEQPPTSQQRLKKLLERTSGPAAGLSAVATIAQLVQYIRERQTSFILIAVAVLAALLGVLAAIAYKRKIAAYVASRRWSAIAVYGSAVLSTLSLLTIASVLLSASLSPVSTPTGDGPASRAPMPPTTTTSPLSTTATTWAPSGPTIAAPSAEGVECQTGTYDYVTLTSIRAADGGRTLNGNLVIDLQVKQAATAGGNYWLMALVPDTPRPLYFARQLLPAGEQSPRVPLTIASGVGSTRQFFVVQSTPDNESWFIDNHRFDADSSWDPNRVTLPPGATVVSNTCSAPRRR